MSTLKFGEQEAGEELMSAALYVEEGQGEDEGAPQDGMAYLRLLYIHPASHVTLWLSSGKFASGSDFKGGAFFLKGGAFFVGILPPLIFREMMQKPTPFFLPPLIIFGKKRAPLNN